MTFIPVIKKRHYLYPINKCGLKILFMNYLLCAFSDIGKVRLSLIPNLYDTNQSAILSVEYSSTPCLSYHVNRSTADLFATAGFTATFRKPPDSLS